MRLRIEKTNTRENAKSMHATFELQRSFKKLVRTYVGDVVENSKAYPWESQMRARAATSFVLYLLGWPTDTAADPAVQRVAAHIPSLPLEFAAIC